MGTATHGGSFYEGKNALVTIDGIDYQTVVTVDENGDPVTGGSDPPTAFGSDSTDATTITSATAWTTAFDISATDVTTLSKVQVFYTGDQPIVLSSQSSPGTTGTQDEEERFVPPFSSFEWAVSSTADISARKDGSTPTRGYLYINGEGV